MTRIKYACGSPPLPQKWIQPKIWKTNLWAIYCNIIFISKNEEAANVYSNIIMRPPAAAAATAVINDIKENSNRLFGFVSFCLSFHMPCSMINRMVCKSDLAERRRRSFAEKCTFSSVEFYIFLYALHLYFVIKQSHMIIDAEKKEQNVIFNKIWRWIRIVFFLFFILNDVPVLLKLPRGTLTFTWSLPHYAYSQKNANIIHVTLERCGQYSKEEYSHAHQSMRAIRKQENARVSTSKMDVSRSLLVSFYCVLNLCVSSHNTSFKSCLFFSF